MKAVLIAWGLSFVFCSFYTLVLPTWDAYVLRRKSNQNQSTERASKHRTETVVPTAKARRVA